MAEGGKKIPRYYWDACVFLSYIEDRPDRAPTIDALLDDCDNKRIEIWSSHLSIVEVAFAKTEKDGQALDPAIEKEIDNLWHPDSPVKLVEVSELVCVGARMLVRDGMIRQVGLKPADAVHLATAKLIGVDEFHTYDERLLNKASVLVPFKIKEPMAHQLSMFTTPAMPPVPPTNTGQSG